ncbi:hypothetical protein E2C01_075263 [Portunus trituberculatus]|uniref:Uncharacterized protein n=1 Tax=Portunus trituberculatus TaxID=210409 RepID=A0A5B7IGM8_PORTR|nr:hypothetical protein [Portunus trituberculatus]
MSRSTEPRQQPRRAILVTRPGRYGLLTHLLTRCPSHPHTHPCTLYSYPILASDSLTPSLPPHAPQHPPPQPCGVLALTSTCPKRGHA